MGEANDDEPSQRIAGLSGALKSAHQTPAHSLVTLPRGLYETLLTEALARIEQLGAGRLPLLAAVRALAPGGEPETLKPPLISLLDTTLLTNAPGEPSVGRQIVEEIESADRVESVLSEQSSLEGMSKRSRLALRMAAGFVLPLSPFVSQWRKGASVRLEPCSFGSSGRLGERCSALSRSLASRSANRKRSRNQYPCALA